LEKQVATDWYTRTFDALYPLVYAHRSVEAARPEAQFAVEQVGMKADDSVLDLCCGNGRHMLHLLSKTPRLVGLDYSADLLRIAARNVGAAGVSEDKSGRQAPADLSDAPGRSEEGPSPESPRTPRLVRADMRRIPFENAFDVVVNFFTSFGYFPCAEENLQVVRGVSAALKPGGRFFIDYVNRAYVEATLVPESVRSQGDYEIHERRWIDAKAGRVNKRTRVTKEAALVTETGESVRLYRLEEFRDLLAGGGLDVDGVFGDYSGAPFDEMHPRMIVVGHKA
jgi:SAM-dependent methyltransferase